MNLPRIPSRAHNTTSIDVDDSIATSRTLSRIRGLEALIPRCGRLGDASTTLHDVKVEVT